jgi:hypothetical protein
VLRRGDESDDGDGDGELDQQFQSVDLGRHVRRREGSVRSGWGVGVVGAGVRHGGRGTDVLAHAVLRLRCGGAAVGPPSRYLAVVIAVAVGLAVRVLDGPPLVFSGIVVAGGAIAVG